MVRITKVYTKAGDQGTTALIGGERVPKYHSRSESYGTVDEVNSILGLVRVLNDQQQPSLRQEKFSIILQAIQQKLFDLGSELATPPGKEYQGQITITEQDIQWLEQVIDKMNEELSPLTSFILPGGGMMHGFLHQARTVCRRAERQTILLSTKETLGKNVIPYLNRLSDAFFVFGRWVSQNFDESEILWKPGTDHPQNWEW